MSAWNCARSVVSSWVLTASSWSWACSSLTVRTRFSARSSGMRLARARLRSGLLRRLLRLQAPDLHALTVEDGTFLGGVLRRNVVTVVHHALLIDPAVGDALLGRGGAGSGRARAGTREGRSGEQPA